jgi:hypothetical protein
MTTKHTPGPWKVVKTDDHISRPKDFRVDGPTYTANSCCGCSDTGNMVLADARLIAAAPELLDALNNFVEFFAPQYYTNSGAEFQKIRADALAAIAKARGES